MFGEYPDAKRGDELQNNGGRHVPNTIHHLQGDPPERRACHHAAGDREQKGRRNCTGRKTVCGNGSDSEAVDQECGRVVQQAFAFEDRQDAMRRSQWAKHGRCGDGVGWRDNGAERNRRSPWQRRDQCANDNSNGDGRESNRDNDQARDRRPVVPEVPERRVIRRIEQYGGDEERQRELGRERDRRCYWNEREQRPAEREEDRIWGADAAGPARQDHGSDEQSQKLFELAHTVREDMDDIVTREHAELPAENGMRTVVLPVTREARRAARPQSPRRSWDEDIA